MNPIANTTASNLTIDEDELETSDQISLYLELIRILEKDIDYSQSRNSREGWNTWGILGAIGAIVVLLLGQTKDLQDIPTDTKGIAIFFIILFQFSLAIYNYLTGSKNLVKEKRLLDINQAFKSRWFSTFTRLMILLTLSYFICTTDYSFWLKITSIILILIPVTYFILTVYFIGKYAKLHLGNNPQHKKISSFFNFAFLFFFLTATILLGSQLKFPIGQSLSAAYVIGLSISTIITLVEVLISNSNSFEPISEFQDLKDDIVFRRVGLNEALKKYKILKEGMSLFDVMKSDFDRIINYLNREEEIFVEQAQLSKKLSELNSQRGDAEQIKIYAKLLENNARELNGLFVIVGNEINPFYKKLQNAAAASGDYETQNLITSIMNKRFNDITKKASETPNQ